MNNTINNVSNVSFNARYIDVNLLDKVPMRIKEAILKSPAIDEFIKAGEPKTFWGKVMDFFKRDEVLEVRHVVSKLEKVADPYNQYESLNFAFGKGIYKQKSFSIRTSQQGVLRPVGSVAKMGEHPLFKEPKDTATEKLARSIENIKDFGVLLK